VRVVLPASIWAMMPILRVRWRSRLMIFSLSQLRGHHGHTL
jgi:hypothetical protein